VSGWTQGSAGSFNPTKVAANQLTTHSDTQMSLFESKLTLQEFILVPHATPRNRCRQQRGVKAEDANLLSYDDKHTSQHVVARTRSSFDATS
jgi:hypothetical protein